MKITIRDIAKVTGISVCTVSLVLNGKGQGKVSDTKRQLILETAEQLGYHPNILARGLATNRSNLVGVVLTHVEASLIPEWLQEVEDRLDALDYGVLLYATHGRPEREARCLERLVLRGVDGILWMPSGQLDPSLVQRISKSTPIVQLFGYTDPKLPFVVVDHIAGGQLATTHLLSCGCTRLAYLAPLGLAPLGSSYAQQRLTGFRQALDGVSQGSLEYRILDCPDDSIRSGYDGMLHLLSSGWIPDGVFAFCDTIAVGIMQALYQAKISVPDKVCIVGFDDVPWGQYLTPALTTVHQPIHLVARLAVEKLFSLIANELVENVVLRPELVLRHSTSHRNSL